MTEHYSTSPLEDIVERTLTGNGSSDQHAITLFAIALASKGKRFLELGVQFGASTLPLLEAARRTDGTLMSVDINDTPFTPPDHLKKHWRFVKSDALAFLRSLPGDQVFDVVYVDDLHTYPHVREELRLLERHLTPSSVLLLHDLMWPRSEPRYHTIPALRKGEFAFGGPYRAVAELDTNAWEWATLPWRNGLTLLRKKSKLWAESRFKIWTKQLLGKVFPWGVIAQRVFRKLTRQE